MINEHPFTRGTRAGLGLSGGAQRGIIAAVAALLIIGGAVIWRIGANSQTPAGPAVKVAATSKNPAIDELVGTTKALDVSQQQVVDQLQVMQEMLAAQQTETRRSSEKIAALSGQLEALRQSFATLPPAVPEEADATPRKPTKKVERPSRSRAAGHRAGPTRKVAKASKAPNKKRVASSRR
jgi:hypothetical protein